MTIEQQKLPPNELPQQDYLKRFLLDRANVRGAWVHLQQSWKDIQNTHEYPQPIKELLGEALVNVALLSSSIKHQGTLILQVRGDGPVHMLVVQADFKGHLRGIARWSERPSASCSHKAMVGNATLALTLESAESNERYQSIIAFEANGLTENIQNYFTQSEQLPTQLKAEVSDDCIAGLYLQTLPSDESMTAEQAKENWERSTHLFNTLTRDELLALEANQLIIRLFHEETPEVYEPQFLQFQCHCSQEKIENTIRTLGKDEAMQVIEEQGEISIDCQFCNSHYRLDREDIMRLFHPLEAHSTVQ